MNVLRLLDNGNQTQRSECLVSCPSPPFKCSILHFQLPSSLQHSSNGGTCQRLWPWVTPHKTCQKMRERERDPNTAFQSGKKNSLHHSDLDQEPLIIVSGPPSGHLCPRLHLQLSPAVLQSVYIKQWVTLFASSLALPKQPTLKHIISI